MDMKEAHDLVLSAAEDNIKGLSDTEVMQNAIMLTRRDLKDHERTARRVGQRKPSKNPHDDLTLTIAQVKAAFGKYQGRSMIDRDQTFEQFLDHIHPLLGEDAVVIEWCGMKILIETDGHTHS